MNNEKRSTTTGMIDMNDQVDALSVGVGGRQEGSQAPTGGGGYLDECTISGPSLKNSRSAANDPRLNDLRSIGISQKLFAVAEVVGFDYFIEIWKIFDQENLNRSRCSSVDVRIGIPRFRSYLLFQRNKYIAALADEGYSTKEISRILKKELCDSVSLRHISRIVSKSKITE